MFYFTSLNSSFDFVAFYKNILFVMFLQLVENYSVLKVSLDDAGSSQMLIRILKFTYSPNASFSAWVNLESLNGKNLG